MFFLSIESSCDETSLAIMEGELGGNKKLKIKNGSGNLHVTSIQGVELPPNSLNRGNSSTSDEKFKIISKGSGDHGVAIDTQGLRIENEKLKIKNYETINRNDSTRQSAGVKMQSEEVEVPNSIKPDFYSYLNSFKVVAQIISSQIKIHAKYGGVIPEIGAREHAQNIHSLFDIVLFEAGEKIKNEKLKIKNGRDNLPVASMQGEDLPPNPPDMRQSPLSISKFDIQNFDYIFVTTNPGLVSALKVGMEFAKSLQFFIKEAFHKVVEIVEINHLQGHVASCFYEIKNEKLKIKNGGGDHGVFNMQGGELPPSPLDMGNSSDLNNELIIPDSVLFPHLHLLVSGGNTQLILLNSWENWEIVGQTLDDAAGETFDKIARMLGLDYPGGAMLSKIAENRQENFYNFPVSMKNSANLNYSFSGLKTAVRYFIEKQSFPNWKFQQKLKPLELNLLLENKNNLPPHLQFIYQVCASAQFAIVSQLLNKLNLAAKKYQPKSLGISGGVSANDFLQAKLFKDFSGPVLIPDKSLTGDNAVMIGLAGIADFYLD